MVSFRWLPLVMALTAASTLVACNTSPAMPMDTMSTGPMAAPDHMAKMDAQMKTMADMRQKMMAAKSPQERNQLMAEHMKTMKDGMAMMGDMKRMQGMTGDRATHHQMMGKRMEMMEMMMSMMGDQMSAMPAR